MFYVTVKQSPRYHQMTLDELLFEEDVYCGPLGSTKAGTRTYAAEKLNDKLIENAHVEYLTSKLREFNESISDLRETKRSDLYYTFHIPKHSGGLRRIDAPNDALMAALRRLKTIFEQDFHAMYHTSAFAYVKGRSTIDAIKRHQSNESRWFAKFDLSNFFGSTTLEFVLSQFAMIYPFSEVMKTEDGREELTKALDMAFLNGVLPQGTPISPLITNIMMIPIDHMLFNKLHEYNRQKYVYTRYADDILISSRYTFMFRDMERLINEVFESFNAPFRINPKKTRYGSRSGANWNLGIMLNKDNEITVGANKKRQFKAMLCSYIMDKSNGITWDLYDVQVMDGLRNYYHCVEGDAIDRIILQLNTKFNVNVREMIKADLSA